MCVTVVWYRVVVVDVVLVLDGVSRLMSIELAV